MTKGTSAGLASLATGMALAALAQPSVAAALWSGLGGGLKLVVDGRRLMELAASHLALSALSLAVGAALGIGLGIGITRPATDPGLRGGVDAVATASQAVPPVVVVALSLPTFGFGAGPTVLALVLYALLPVLRGTVAAIQSVPAEVREAARALGHAPAQILWRVELPMAAPLMVESVRIALVLVVATASVGAFGGAATLGTPIVAGLQNQNDLEVLQGAAATAALAFLAEGALLLAAVLLPVRGRD